MRPSKSSSRKFADDTIKVMVLIIVLSISLLYYYRSAPTHKANERTFILRLSVTYENRGTDVWNLTEDDCSIGLFGNNSWQTVYLANHSLPVKSFNIDEDGNYIAVLDPQRNHISPETTFNYHVEYRIIRKSGSIPDVDEQFSLGLGDIPKATREKFCKAEGPWQVNDSEIVDLAHRIIGNETNVLTMIRKFVGWIKGNIGYRSSDIPRYPNETLKERFGDCDDQANLLITFCRLYGIPAHLQIGCMYLPSKVNETSHSWDGHLTTILSRIGWHGWAMVYVPPWGWLPVDLTYAQGISADPLNSMKKSAIILQETVQYFNITKTDYIALSESLRIFLKEHRFYMYESDEMREESTADTSMGSLRFLQTLIVKPVFPRHQNYGEAL